MIRNDAAVPILILVLFVTFDVWGGTDKAYTGVQDLSASGMVSWTAPVSREMPETSALLDVNGNPTLVLHLYPGWNLISIGFDLSTADLLTVLGPISEDYESVWTYDSLWGTWRKCTKSPFHNDIYIIEPGKGYWIRMIREAILIVSGKEVSDRSVSLRNGWNMVGYNSLVVHSSGLVLSGIRDNLVAAYGYDARTQTWKKYFTDAVPVGTNEELFQFKPGKGYFIAVNSNCTWTVTP